ncbi:MAG: Gldg family protein [Methylacidiphilales bacterium]|nr:Gldg family protein [Candidatus Methylacidiphilales bacterium]
MQKIPHLITYIFIIALIALSSQLAPKLTSQLDVSYSKISSLRPETIKTLAQYKEPVTITLYVDKENSTNSGFETLLQRYADASPLFKYSIISIEQRPDLAQSEAVTAPVELVLKHKLAARRIQNAITERAITIALQSLLRGSQETLFFLADHNERSINGEQLHDYSLLANILFQRGMQLSSYSLVKFENFADNVKSIIVPGPTTDYRPQEVEQLAKFINRGGNALFLLEDTTTNNLLKFLEKEFGITLKKPTLIELDDPDKTGLVIGFGNQELPITKELRTFLLFFQPREITTSTVNSWTAKKMIVTKQGAVLGYEFSRSLASTDSEQKVYIVSDADIFANKYIQSGANLLLANNLFNTVLGEVSSLNLETPALPDQTMENEISPLKSLFLFIFALGFIVYGLMIWWKRSRAYHNGKETPTTKSS